MPAFSLYLPRDNLQIGRDYLVDHIIKAGFVSPA
jgi:hypothetical protein